MTHGGRARRQASTASTAVAGVTAVAAVVASVVLVAVAAPGQAAGFDEDTWTSAGPVLDSGITSRKAASLEVLPDGRLMALAVVGDDGTYGHAGSSVLVSRILRTNGTWSDPQAVDLGTGAVSGRTFDTFVDPEGRVLAAWSEQSATPGVWPVRSVSRDTAGVWGVPEEVYVARTNGALSDLLEVNYVAPRLVPGGNGATVAWADFEGVPGARINVDDNPFQARRWSAGSWGPTLTSDAYGAESAKVSPTSPEFRQVHADPVQASRASDGRISYVFTLHKRRAVHTMSHPLSDGFELDENTDDVWDGIPERPWDASTDTAWVVHLDPGDPTWGEPAPLITSGGPLVSCASPDLPANPPLAAFWQEWKDFSESPGISTSCPGTSSSKPSGSYTETGELRINLAYRSDPTADVVLNQFLTDPCDAAPADDPFCFDDWGTPDWAVDWPQARIAIPAGAGQPGADAVAEGYWTGGRSHTVSTTGGGVTVTDQHGVDGRSILFDRASGTDVTWTDPGITSGVVTVSHVFADEDDVAVFYRNGSGTDTPRCGMLVLRGGAGAASGPIDVCQSAADAYRQDVVQLPDGRLARIDGATSGAPVRLFGSDQPTDPTPTDPTGTTEPPPPGSSSPAPLPPTVPTTTPTQPQAPAPSQMVAVKAPVITGKVKVGRVLRASAGTWQPAATSVRYQWLLGKKKIARATKAKLRLKKAWKGKRIAVRITVSAPGAVPETLKVKARGRVR